MDIFKKSEDRAILDVVNDYAFNDIYFASEGLTSASANHVSAMAQIYANGKMERMKGIRLYEKRIKVIGEEEESVVERENAILDELSEAIKEISKANALTAWLREAIKEKDACLEHIANTDLTTWCSKQGIELPARPEKPVRPNINLNDVKTILEAGFSVKEFNRYIELCSTLATYGEFIHHKGIFTEAINKLSEILRNPTSVKENGRDTIITSFIPYDNPEKVRRTFLSLQGDYRKLQAEKNGIETKYSKLAMDYQLRKKEEYERAVKQWETDLQHYTSEHDQLTLQMNDWKRKETDRVSALKIIIPNDLQGVYAKVME